MNIDQRDIKKGPLPEILPQFYPESISYLSELNDYRIYAEMWSNQRITAWQKRKEIGHEGYLKTLAMGEVMKRRNVDKVRFDSFIVADSVNYTVKGNDKKAHIVIGSMQNNATFNNIIKENRRLSTIQSQFTSVDFHSEGYIPELLECNLWNLNLQKDTKKNKYFFEILTNSTEISNNDQKMILFQVFGKDALSEKLLLLSKVNRKAIRFLFDDPVYLEQDNNAVNTISRLCVARPFDETIVIDFAATLAEYEEACLLGTLIRKTGQTDKQKWYENLLSYC